MSTHLVGLRRVRALVEESASWKLSNAGWEAVATARESISEALAAEDAEALAEAEDDLRELNPHSRIGEAEPDVDEEPAEYKERINGLIHEITVKLDEEPATPPKKS